MFREDNTKFVYHLKNARLSGHRGTQGALCDTSVDKLWGLGTTSSLVSLGTCFHFGNAEERRPPRFFPAQLRPEGPRGRGRGHSLGRCHPRPGQLEGSGSSWSEGSFHCSLPSLSLILAEGRQSPGEPARVPGPEPRFWDTVVVWAQFSLPYFLPRDLAENGGQSWGTNIPAKRVGFAPLGALTLGGRLFPWEESSENPSMGNPGRHSGLQEDRWLGGDARVGN